MLVEREMYMSRIRPFIGKDVIKVMTGMRRCGKSVMLELVKRELVREGVSEANFFSYNFEDLTISNLCEAPALHNDVCKRVQGAIGKVYLFFDEIQEVSEWEKAINSLRVRLDCDNRFKCKIAFFGAKYLPCRSLCRICHLPVFFWRVPSSLPSVISRSEYQEVLQRFHFVWRNAVLVGVELQ